MSSVDAVRRTVAFRFANLSAFPLVQAMSGRTAADDDGDLGYTPHNDHARIDANRDRFLNAVGVEPEALTLGRQVHGATVQVVGAADRGRGRPPRFDGFPATDALVTDAPDVALGTIVADCVPIVIYDPRRHAVGIAHAGWRGTVAAIARETVRVMRDTFGSRPDDLLAGIGPSIGPCCYEVGPEVVAAWEDANVAGGTAAIVRRAASYHFDLWAANRLLLVEAGLPDAQIETSDICTRCRYGEFFSYRAARAGLSPSGRMMMVVQLGART